MSLRHLLAATALWAAVSGAAVAQSRAPFKTPVPVGQMGPKLNPGYHHPLDVNLSTPAQWQAFRAAVASGAVNTLPTSSGAFSIAGKSYGYTLVGTAPTVPLTTVIPTVIVPIRLTVSDYSVDGVHPVVLDGTRAIPSMLGSPIFHASPYAIGNLQFADAMLRTEFPNAAGRWHTVFSPSVAAPIDIVAPPGTVRVIKTKSGNLLGVIRDGSIIDIGRDAPINVALRAASPQTYVVFVTYNALEASAFGYHSFAYTQKKASAVVYTYTSWLEGVNDAFTIPSPDAATLAHEIAEVVHDPLITSVTLKWGDAFNNNRCFQKLIEVGDAVEDAPAKVQLWKQTVQAGGTVKTYTLQTEALLPWFERQTPSTALDGAYSFPDQASLTTAAPLTCVG
ncbi:MAG: hypothetical protein ACR2F8_00450 [Caulobacteraceae bacterium]